MCLVTGVCERVSGVMPQNEQVCCNGRVCVERTPQRFGGSVDSRLLHHLKVGIIAGAPELHIGL